MLDIVEELTVFAPLGIRFWDPVLNEQIRDGLRVRAWRETGNRRVVEAYRTMTNIYALRDLPGLRAAEYPTATAAPPASPPTTVSYVVQVDDRRERFVEAAFGVDLPLPYRGLYLSGSSASPSRSPAGFHLYSTARRKLPATIAVVRGELAERAIESDSPVGRPARYAVVRVELEAPDSQPHIGLADAEGRFAVYFPYPVPAEDYVVSPPVSPHQPLADQMWNITVEVGYAPGELECLARTEVPNYLSVLTQTAAAIWHQVPASASPPVHPVAQWEGRLQFGRPVVLQTEGLSKLLVSPLGSSP
jgi:hypothetical protein